MKEQNSAEKLLQKLGVSPPSGNNATYNDTPSGPGLATPRSVADTNPTPLILPSMLQQPIDIVSMKGVNPKSNTSYDTSIQPGVAFSTILTRHPFKFDISPYNVAFDSSGLTQIGSDTYSAVTLDFSDLITDGSQVLAVLLFVRQTNKLLGSSDFSIVKPSAGVNLDFILCDDVGTVSCLNVAKNNRASVSATVTTGNSTATSTFNQTNTAVDDFLQFAPTDSATWEVRGINSTITVYPIVNRIEVANALVASIFSGTMANFGEVIASQMYSSFK